MIYDKECPEYGDLMLVEDFQKHCKAGSFIDYDGYGCPVREGKMMSLYIYPSDLITIPEDATHIIWFNR